MKTAACIALLALAASACSKNDTTQTPAGMTTSPETATATQMPVETAAPNEITTAPPADPALQGTSDAGMNGKPGMNGSAGTNGSTGMNDGTARGTPGNGATATANVGGTSTASAAPSRPDADNTRVNERDRGTSTTPMDQGNNDTDLKITQKIRQAVMGDGGLSFTAKNVKIITNKGTVVLRGPVKTDDERARIDSAAKSVAGASNVINEIEIKK